MDTSAPFFPLVVMADQQALYDQLDLQRKTKAKRRGEAPEVEE